MYSQAQTNYYTNTATSSNDGTTIFVVILVLAIIIALVIVLRGLLNRMTKIYQLKMTKKWVMYKIMVPKERHAEDDDQKKDFHELLSVVEPFYASVNSLFQSDIKSKTFGQPHITLEIIAKKGLISFYVGCPVEYSSNVLKNLNAQYPHAEIMPDKNYSIFSENEGKIDIVNLGLAKRHVFPIKTYKSLEEDPLNAISNSLSKLNEGETAAIQLIFRPTSGYWRMHSETTIRKIQEGKYYSNSSSKLINGSQALLDWSAGMTNKVLTNTDKPEEVKSMTPVQENQIKMVGDKATKLGFECQLRIIASAKTKPEANNNIKNICSAFYQLNSPEGNNFIVARRKFIAGAIAEYVFRIFGSGPKMILNTEELASIFHAPNRFTDTPNISWLMGKKEPPPANLPTEGTIIGRSNYRGQTKDVRIKLEDRLRHVYTIGQTGVGKTVLAQNMVLQDIMDGHGVCYLDPNGDAAEWILNHIPKERADDVIYFNPSDKERPFGLNMLEWKTPDQRDFLVQESLQIFQKLFDPNQTGMVGPQFEHWMRNAALTLMMHPDGGTIIDIPRIFTDPEFEKDRVKYVTDPVVRSFWEKQMAKTADFHKSEMLNYFTSKFGRFMTNDMIRNIIGQTKSSFDFRDVMDSKKILICNLSKGMIGEINAFLLGMIIVSKIAMGAFSRQDILEKDRIPFFLYVDEFQNFITDVFATILSESRKYKLGLYITHQYIEQLDEKIRAAVFGNAGTLAAFRIGAADSEVIAKYFDPLKSDDLTTIDKYNMYARMLIDGAPTRPFNIQTIWPEDYAGNPKMGAAIKELSRLKYGKPKEIVEEEILERSQVDKIELPGLNSEPQRAQ